MIPAAILIFLYFCVFFVIGTRRKNNSVVDVGWGLGFVLAAWTALLIRLPASPARWTAALVVTVWGLRLFTHILRRSRGKPEDPRYAKFRAAWGKRAVLRAFFQIYLLQGLLMYTVALPLLLPAAGAVNRALYAAGLAVFALGFGFEVVGDRQLSAFLRNPARKGMLMTEGLWRYTRHPNYFGEATLWWGVWLIAVSGGVTPFSAVGPATITLLLLFVSGVPPLEAAMKNRPGYAAYARRTSVFVPWFPKRPDADKEA
jgi:steroid 5-alpha reductase family enzyme